VSRGLQGKGCAAPMVPHRRTSFLTAGQSGNGLAGLVFRESTQGVEETALTGLVLGGASQPLQDSGQIGGRRRATPSRPT
jgi:hypothetical protein